MHNFLGFQYRFFLDLYRILFQADWVFKPEHDFLFKSASTYCGLWPHNDLRLLKTKLQLAPNTYFMASNSLDHVPKQGNGQRNKWNYGHTKISEIFATSSMPKKHRKFCRRGLTHLDATPTFKHRSENYVSPCITSVKTTGKSSHLTKLRSFPHRDK